MEANGGKWWQNEVFIQSPSIYLDGNKISRFSSTGGYGSIVTFKVLRMESSQKIKLKVEGGKVFANCDYQLHFSGKLISD